ncbi:MAG: hypothetical protein AAFR01_06150, partial [Pseudomonadota bacterium]
AVLLGQVLVSLGFLDRDALTCGRLIDGIVPPAGRVSVVIELAEADDCSKPLAKVVAVRIFPFAFAKSGLECRVGSRGSEQEGPKFGSDLRRP